MTSRNCLPPALAFPIFANSRSASSANLYLAVRRLTAGFGRPPAWGWDCEGKIDCCGFEALGMNCPESEGSEEDCWDCGEEVCEWEGVRFAGFCNGGLVWKLKVEELENVGFGCTGPSSWSRALRPGLGASSSGSWASVPIAVIQ